MLYRIGCGDESQQIGSAGDEYHGCPLTTQSLGLSSGCTEIDAGARHQFLVAKSYGLAAQVTANTLTGNGAKVGDNRRRQRIPAGLGSNGLSQGMLAVLLEALCDTEEYL